MKKVLFSAATYFQILVCIQLKNTVYKNAQCDILIADVSYGYEHIIDRLKHEKIFAHIYPIKYYKYYKQKKWGIIKLFIRTLLDKRCFLKNLDGDFCYDEFLFNNFGIPNLSICYALYLDNQEIVISRFEEGYISYLSEHYEQSGVVKIYEWFANKNKKKRVSELIRNMYYFCPELIDTDTAWSKIPILPIDKTNRGLRQLYSGIFLAGVKLKEYSYKYIFFEEAFFEDQRRINDLQIILKIAEKVGKENILVKLHPRSHYNRFAEYGIQTNQTVGVPWEIIQLCGNCKDAILLTISSASVLSPGLVLDDFLKTYLLFQCQELDGWSGSVEFLDWLSRYKTHLHRSNVMIPRNLAELFQDLERKE